MKIRLLNNNAKKDENWQLFTRSKLFYVLLVMCLVVVGTAGYVIRERNKIKQEVSNSGIELPDLSSRVIPNKPDDVFASLNPEVEDAVASDTPIEKDEPAEDVPVVEENVKLIMPLKGNLLKEYSGNDLVYSKTLQDWRRHDGIDISATIGDTVSASADGVVLQAYEDVKNGFTIVIEHNGGLKTKYSNLSSVAMVSIGTEVAKGDVIAVVGDTALFEISDESHLHFEVLKDDIQVNPNEYLEN